MQGFYHMESKTRGAENNEVKVRRFQREIEYMRCNWIDILKNGDPNYNKNLFPDQVELFFKTTSGHDRQKGGRLRRHYAGSISHYSQL